MIKKKDMDSIYCQPLLVCKWHFRDVWFGVVHHVCGEHEWAEAGCNHGPLSSEEPKAPLDKKSAAAEVLR